MTEVQKKIHVENSGLGMLWFVGWLFTIGYAKLGFWAGLFGLFVWPYYLGDHLASGGAG